MEGHILEDLVRTDFILSLGASTNVFPPGRGSSGSGLLQIIKDLPCSCSSKLPDTVIRLLLTSVSSLLLTATSFQLFHAGDRILPKSVPRVSNLPSHADDVSVSVIYRNRTVISIFLFFNRRHMRSCRIFPKDSLVVEARYSLNVCFTKLSFEIPHAELQIPNRRPNSSCALLDAGIEYFFAFLSQAASPICVWNKLANVLDAQHCAVANRYFPVSFELSITSIIHQTGLSMC